MTRLQSSNETDGSKNFNNRCLAIIEVAQGETDKEAWLRHLAAHPEDRHADVYIFNRPWLT